MQNAFPLSALQNDQNAVIYRLEGEQDMRERLENLGFTEHTPITCLFASAFGDPRAYRLRNTVIALREKDAQTILCRRYEDSL